MKGFIPGGASVLVTTGLGLFWNGPYAAPPAKIGFAAAGLLAVLPVVPPVVAPVVPPVVPPVAVSGTHT